MNDTELDKMIRRLPAPELPTEWRDEILRVAGSENGRGQSTPAMVRPGWLRLPYWLTPARASWGGLAVAWSVILLLHASSGPALESDRQAPEMEYSEAVELMRARAELIVDLGQPQQEEAPPRSSPLGDGRRPKSRACNFAA